MAENMRGVRIIIEYVGECQHQGIIILQFHKGNVYVEHEVLPYANDWETLWRT